MKTIDSTSFHFPDQQDVFHGKVRDVYTVGQDLLIMVVTDRISAFDVVLPRSIPFKGQVLNQIAAHFLMATAEEVPNWMLAMPDPNVTAGIRCHPFKVEMVIRGYLCGHAWRLYRSGNQSICGVKLPPGLKENDPLPEPIITPTTKASEGHDRDLSRQEIISGGLVCESDYTILENYTQRLYRKGRAMAARQGLILADTKYEFGRDASGQIRIIDEIHTPDSSRYFYADGFEQRQKKGLPQKQLSKEFLRQWLIENDFSGMPGQTLPVITDEIVERVSARYIELYEKLIGEPFQPDTSADPVQRIENNVLNWLKSRLHP
jgi:phosphoribosylaminoimidazole-succinocarboxamide synthase